LAKYAFSEGRDREALRYLYALVLTDDAQGAEILKTIKWAPKLLRPAIIVRWGVGVHPEGAAGGGESDSSSKRRGGDTTSLSESGLGGLIGRTSEEIFSDSYLRGRMARGYYGEALKTALLTGGQPVRRAPQGGGGGMEPGADAAAPGADAAAPGADAAAPGAGAAGGPMGGPRSGGGGRRSGGGEGGRGRVLENIPGVTVLRKGNEEELLQRAAREGIDALLVFHVKSKVIGLKKKSTSRSVAIDLFDVASKTKLFAMKKPINLPTTSEAFEKQREEIYASLSELFAEADKHFQMVELPADAQPQPVLGRVSTLVAQEKADPLRALAEIKFYHSRGLLPDNELTTAFQGLLGDEPGAQLASGDAEAKKKVVETLLSSGQGAGQKRLLPDLPPLR
jgi:hypothetical protein